MNRRAFIKGLIALASAPAIGKYVNVFKTEGAREGIGQVVGQGVDFFNMVIKKVIDEGTLVKEQDRISTYKHPDRPDITVDVDQTTGSSSVYFDTDEGGKAMGEITKTMDEGTGGAVVEDLMEAEEIYGPYGRDVQEGISGGITNLEKFLKSKKGFAAGGRVGMFMGGKLPQGAALLRQMIKMTAKEKGLENPSEMLSKFNPKKIDKLTNDPNLLFMKADVRDGIMATDKVKDFKNTAQSARVDIVTHLLDMAKTLRSTNLTNKAQNNIMIQEAVKMGMDRKQAEFLVKGLSESIEKAAGMPYNAPRPTEQGILELETLLKNLKTGGKPPRALNADGGRVGMFRGGVPKGLQAALRAIMGKYGDDAITTADKAPQPEKTIQEQIMDFNARTKSGKRSFKGVEIKDPTFDLTMPYDNDAEKLAEIKMSNEAYDMEKARGTEPKLKDIFTDEVKIKEAVDDIFPTGDYKMDAQMAAESFVENNPQAFNNMLFDDLDQRTQMKIYDLVLTEIQTNMAKMRELKKLTKPTKTLEAMKAGKGIDMSDPDIAAEFTRFMQESDPKGFKDIEEKIELMNFNPKGRKKNADGGSVDGDVSLTVIKIPDISESGVESLFKRR